MARISDGPPRGMRQSIDAAEPHELDRRLVAGVLDQDDRVVGQAGLGAGLPQHAGDGEVGLDGARRAPEEGGVART